MVSSWLLSCLAREQLFCKNEEQVAKRQVMNILNCKGMASESGVHHLDKVNVAILCGKCKTKKKGKRQEQKKRPKHLPRCDRFSSNIGRR